MSFCHDLMNGGGGTEASKACTTSGVEIRNLDFSTTTTIDMILTAVTASSNAFMRLRVTFIMSRVDGDSSMRACSMTLLVLTEMRHSVFPRAMAFLRPTNMYWKIEPKVTWNHKPLQETAMHAILSFNCTTKRREYVAFNVRKIRGYIVPQSMSVLRVVPMRRCLQCRMSIVHLYFGW